MSTPTAQDAELQTATAAVEEAARAARAASRQLITLTTEQKNAALHAAADSLPLDELQALVLTYDVADLIKSLYKARDVSEFRLLYSAHLRGTKDELKRTSASELIVLSNPVADALVLRLVGGLPGLRLRLREVGGYLKTRVLGRDRRRGRRRGRH